MRLRDRCLPAFVKHEFEDHLKCGRLEYGFLGSDVTSAAPRNWSHPPVNGVFQDSMRYCVRPPFALERLEALDAHRLLYRLPKPCPYGSTELMLSPLELIGRLAALIPPPSGHRYRYPGITAPDVPLR